jgi:hypothetical protein
MARRALRELLRAREMQDDAFEHMGKRHGGSLGGCVPFTTRDPATRMARLCAPGIDSDQHPPADESGTAAAAAGPRLPAQT